MCLLVEEYGSTQLGSTIRITKKAVAIGTEVMAPLIFGRDQRYRKDLLQGIEKVSDEGMQSRTEVTSAGKTKQKSTNQNGVLART